jgi:hypothetical protein
MQTMGSDLQNFSYLNKGKQTMKGKRKEKGERLLFSIEKEDMKKRAGYFFLPGPFFLPLGVQDLGGAV